MLLLLPPLFSAVPFTLPPKPIGLYAQCVFYFYTVFAAAYEEILYRLYTPNRLHCIYTGYIEPRLQENWKTSECPVHLPLPSFLCVCCKNNTGVFFEFFLTEFPAHLLFTLAHRYLGLSSMIFAAGAGIVFRIAYLKLKQVFHPAVSITLVAAVHGLWNIGVYYYLWGNTGIVN
ncbi:CPBP family glutamic-type intramembrane protease [Treponema sp. OMZ 857]|uniref:CPBP family glutamic-type intramembrane protease n=1 Tax=Treponema sp. OMZ 857 TaxID=1643513 RepID=UPI0020A5649D|nr:CPBP family glutamic-type intramembrane protease [Treponema sp. OMZ 857]